MNNYLKKKNLSNTQNYVIGKKLKNNLIFDFIFIRNKSGLFLLSIFLYIIKYITSKLIYYIKGKNKDAIFYVLFHLIIFLFCIQLYFLLPFFYIILYIYLSIIFVEFYETYKVSNLYILGFKKNNQNEYINYGYKDSLIDTVTIKEGILEQNGINILIALKYSALINFIFLGLYMLIF